MRERGDAFAVPLDVTDDADVSAAARLMEERAGRLDVLVSNAGAAGGWPDEPTSLDPAACPGYVATDLNGFSGTRTAEEGAQVAIRLATLPDDGPTGGLFDDGGPVPW